MFIEIINQEKLLRKSLQMFIRDLVGSHPLSASGGKLYFNSQEQFTKALSIVKGAQSSDLRNLSDSISNSLKTFNGTEAFTFYISFDPENNISPEQQTYETSVFTDALGKFSDTMPITDYSKLCELLRLADTTLKLENES